MTDDDLVESWTVVFRNGKPYAMFKKPLFAEDYVRDGNCPWRKQDTLAIRRIIFKGIKGYKRNKGKK